MLSRSKGDLCFDKAFDLIDGYAPDLWGVPARTASRIHLPSIAPIVHPE
jgi:hypothetical protein